jgi:L1 cell adhesion molecule like protein
MSREHAGSCSIETYLCWNESNKVSCRYSFDWSWNQIRDAALKALDLPANTQYALQCIDRQGTTVVFDDSIPHPLLPLRPSGPKMLRLENLGIPVEAPPISSLYVDNADFQVLDQIECCSRRAVFKVRHIPTGAVVAMKRLHRADETYYLRGVLIPATFSHPTILPVLGCTHSVGQPAIIQPLTEAGSLQSVLNEVHSRKAPASWTLPAKMIILLGVATGVAVLHDRQVWHGDLRPANILLDANREPKISNFARSKSASMAASLPNTWDANVPTMYDAPEIVQSRKSCDFKADVFSFGIMMYIVLTESEPRFPHCRNRVSVSERIVKGDRPTFPRDTPEQLMALVKRCWDADPNKRPEFREIVDAFADPELISAIPGLSFSPYGEYQDRIKIDRIDPDPGSQSFAAIAAASRPLTIGIDFGTTRSSVGYFTRRGPELIRSGGHASIPSVVAFQGNKWEVGEDAADFAWRYPTTTIYDMKRMLGCSFDMPAIRAAMRSWPFRVSRGDAGEILIDIEESNRVHQYHPYELTAKILARLKQMAEATTGETVREAVISVPACFGDSQREDMMKAATIAGLEATLVNAPAIGAIADEFNIEPGKKKTVLVFNFGGGTLDLSLIDLTPNCCTVQAVSGDSHLGGRDFDQVLMEFCLERFDPSQRTRVDTITGKQSHLLRTACEMAKRHLSNSETTRVIARAFHDREDFDVRVTRGEFEAKCKHLLDRIHPLMEEVLRFGGIEAEAIDEMILIGGSSRIPAVRTIIEGLFRKPRLFRIPCLEVVAEGATILAGKIMGRSGFQRIEDVQLLDICPLSIGLRCDGGRMKVIIPTGTKLPATVTKRMRPDHLNAAAPFFHVYEGPWQMTKRNPRLATFRVESRSATEGGDERAEITFNLDSNRILSVTAAVVSGGIRIDLPVRKTTCLRGRRRIEAALVQSEVDQAADAREWNEATRRRVIQSPP